MKPKVGRGAGFRGLLEYVLNQKKDGSILSSSMAGNTPRELAREFGSLRSLNPNCAKPVWHCSLSLPAGENLDQQHWDRVVKTFMREMKLQDAAYIAAIHRDTDHEHIHIVASRILPSGELWLGKYEGKLAQAASKVVEQECNLMITYNPDPNDPPNAPHVGRAEREILARQGQEQSPREIIATAIESALADKPDLDVFAARLAASSIIAKPARDEKTGQILGFSFALDGQTYRASAIARAYGWKHLASRLSLDLADVQAAPQPEPFPPAAPTSGARVSGRGTTLKSSYKLRLAEEYFGAAWTGPALKYVNIADDKAVLKLEDGSLITDSGDHISVDKVTEDSIAAMLEAARLHEWTELTFTGSDDFRRRAARAAALAGFECGDEDLREIVAQAKAERAKLLEKVEENHGHERDGIGAVGSARRDIDDARSAIAANADDQRADASAEQRSARRDEQRFEDDPRALAEDDDCAAIARSDSERLEIDSRASARTSDFERSGADRGLESSSENDSERSRIAASAGRQIVVASGDHDSSSERDSDRRDARRVGFRSLKDKLANASMPARDDSRNAANGRPQTALVDSQTLRAALTVDPTGWLKSRGHNVIRTGPHGIEIKGLYRLDRQNNGEWLWCDWSGNDGGDLISLVREETNCSFRDAVETLTGQRQQPAGATVAPPQIERTPPRLPAQTAADAQAGRAYLLSRGISAETVAEAERQGMLRYSAGAVIAVGRDSDGRPQAAFARMTAADADLKKRDFRGTDKAFAPILHGDPKRVEIVEGLADALAVRDLARIAGEQPPTVIVSGGAGVRRWTEEPTRRAILENAESVRIWADREADADTQRRTLEQHHAQAAAVRAVTRAAVDVQQPAAGHKDPAAALAAFRAAEAEAAQQAERQAAAAKMQRPALRTPAAAQRQQRQEESSSYDFE
jgi:hypothetical protein